MTAFRFVVFRLQRRRRLPVSAATGKTQVDTMDRARFLRQAAAASVVAGGLVSSSWLQPALSAEVMGKFYVQLILSSRLLVSGTALRTVHPNLALRLRRPRICLSSTYELGSIVNMSISNQNAISLESKTWERCYEPNQTQMWLFCTNCSEGWHLRVPNSRIFVTFFFVSRTMCASMRYFPLPTCSANFP